MQHYNGILANDPNVYDKKFKLAEGISVIDIQNIALLNYHMKVLYILKKYSHNFYNMIDNPNHVDIHGLIAEPTILFKMNPIGTYDEQDQDIVLELITENCIFFTPSQFNPIDGNQFIEDVNGQQPVGGRRHRKSLRKSKRRQRKGRKSRRHH